MPETPTTGLRPSAHARAAADDLLALACDRDESTAEIFTPNEWYGNGKTIRDYAGWPYPLPFVIPHGIYLSDTYLWDAEKCSELQAVYNFTKHRNGLYERTCHLREIPGCSPWLYLLKMRQALIKDDDRVGTVAFPMHSTHHVAADMDDAAYARTLLDLPGDMLPVKVCLYWKDIQCGRHLAYQAAGIEVVTAGHMFDREFLNRLFEIFRPARHLHTNKVGSHIFYGAACGLAVTVDDRVVGIPKATAELVARDVAPAPTEMNSQIQSIYARPVDVRRQREFALDLLGRNNLLSRQRLRILIVRCYLHDRWIFKRLWRSLRGQYYELRQAALARVKRYLA